MFEVVLLVFGLSNLLFANISLNEMLSVSAFSLPIIFVIVVITQQL